MFYVSLYEGLNREDLEHKLFEQEKENKQLKDNWKELKEGLIGAISLLKDATDKTNTTIKDTFIGVLSKMQELEQGKDERNN